ncbi:MAG: hypothetical protein ACD_73C00021G0003 [uncultured bacterium]|nr:MAG: hypothetical protein ACD_73C00021G0003 [uncultured bacterium]
MITLILDGYNLIRRNDKQLMVKADKDMGRTQLLKALYAHYENKNCLVIVVFDALYSDNRVIEESTLGILKVIYTKFAQTADELIIELASKERSNAIVVSSDKGILKAVKQFGCGIMESDVFLNKLYFESRLNVDAFGKEDEVIKKSIHPDKKGPRKKKPKAERRALSKFSKI